MPDTTEVRMRDYRVGRRGQRGFVVTLPTAWVEDMKLQPGDLIEMLRDTRDRLIIAPPVRDGKS